MSFSDSIRDLELLTFSPYLVVLGRRDAEKPRDLDHLSDMDGSEVSALLGMDMLPGTWRVTAPKSMDRVFFAHESLAD